MLRRDRVQRISNFLIAMLWVPVSAGAAEVQKGKPITLHYVDRPPYAISQADGVPTGVVAIPADRAFRKARIPFVWEKTPVNRQFAIIKENQGLDCAVGFEETPTRMAFGKFTKPLYISQPFIALTSLKVKEKSGVTLDHMLSRYTILVKQNYTQGDGITARIMKSPNKYVTSGQSAQMVRMIARGRADFMMISNDEVEYFVQHGVLDPKDIRVITISDVKVTFNRRIMCSKRVDDALLERLNRVIATMNIKPTPFRSVKDDISN